jgi:hypothetical protein
MNDLGAAAGLEIGLYLRAAGLQLSAKLLEQAFASSRRTIGEPSDLMPQAGGIEKRGVERCRHDHPGEWRPVRGRRRLAVRCSSIGIRPRPRVGPMREPMPCLGGESLYTLGRPTSGRARTGVELDRFLRDGRLRGLRLVGLRHCPGVAGGAFRAEQARRSTARGRACRAAAPNQAATDPGGEADASTAGGRASRFRDSGRRLRSGKVQVG